MTNDELKKKIVEVLKKAMEPIEYGGDSEHAPEVHYPTEEEIADALIAAGIGDVSKWKAYAKVHRIVITKDDKIKQLYSDEEVDKIVSERAEYKRRAEIAERAFFRLVHEMYEQDIRPMCDEKFFIESRLKDAEKELAEEGER